MNIVDRALLSLYLRSDSEVVVAFSWWQDKQNRIRRRVLGVKSGVVTFFEHGDRSLGLSEGEIQIPLSEFVRLNFEEYQP